MARPRIFISSTFYDLKQVRSELEHFLLEAGYDPVLNERGHIAYGKDEPPQNYCYREISNVDILVSIIGGRFGSDSTQKGLSVSQAELETALKLHKQVYIFVERNVRAEYETYQVNKEKADLKYRYADIQVYKHLDYVFGLPSNNALASFEFAKDITTYLKEQWAGLFQRLMQENEQRERDSLVQDLSASVRTLNELVQYIVRERKNTDEAIKTIVSYNHPLFEHLKAAVGAQYRIFFLNKKELDVWLRARSFGPVAPEFWDDADIEEWMQKPDQQPRRLLKFATLLFDERGALKPFTPAEWDKSWVTVEDVPPPQPETPATLADDDIPF